MGVEHRGVLATGAGRRRTSGLEVARANFEIGGALNERRHFMKRIALLLFTVAMVFGVVAPGPNIYTDQRASSPTNRGPPSS